LLHIVQSDYVIQRPDSKSETNVHEIIVKCH